MGPRWERELLIFQSRDLTLVNNLLMMVIIGFTVANSIAPKFATGAHPIKTVFYVSLISIISDACLLFMPPVAQKLLV